MSKPIKLTAQLLRQIEEEFSQQMRTLKMSDGKITYTRKLEWDAEGDCRATITFTSTAFAKMLMLLQSFDSEVAWHGIAKRSETKKNAYIISDILVYPQEVSGATVNTDQIEYQEWLYSFDDDVFNDIRMQGHSHVNMQTSPSGVDLQHQESILAQLDDDMFYIFMIWNKKLERTIRIFDFRDNTLYENNDIDLRIGEDGVDLKSFVEDAKVIVRKKTYTSPYYQNYQNYYPAQTPAYPTTPAANVATSPTTTTKNNAVGGTTGEKPKEKPNIGSTYGKYHVDEFAAVRALQ